MMYFEQKRYLEREHYHPVVVKDKSLHEKENGHLDNYQNHLIAYHKCYESCVAV